jgi:cystathionine beta-lyase/cystathionine gamma-synthase
MGEKRGTKGKIPKGATAEWKLGFSTKVGHFGHDTKDSESSRPAVEPVFQTSVYEFDTLDSLEEFNKGGGSKYWYGRFGLPNPDLLGEAIAEMEGFDEGFVCSSGMGAITSTLLGLLSSHGKVVAISDVYGGTHSVLQNDLLRLGIDVKFVDTLDTTQLDKEISLRRSERFGNESALVIVETETNPTLKIPDLTAISESCQKNGATLVVDNTFATPYNCQPKKFGADIVVHSATKFLGGHDDLTLGVVVANSSILSRIKQFAIRIGLTSASPWDSWLCLRSIRTLGLRMRQANENAAALAEFLSRRPEVSRVIYPGLPSHPQHKLAKRIFQNGAGALLSFELEGGYAAVRELIKRFQLIKLVPSLGSIRTTVSYPPLSSHRSVPKTQREAMGITDGFLRVSVGIEDTHDLVQDFQKALTA